MHYSIGMGIALAFDACFLMMVCATLRFAKSVDSRAYITYA